MEHITDKETQTLKNLADQTREAARKAKEKLDLHLREKHKARMEPLKALVERAHKCFCPFDHNSGCGWGYERDDWSGAAHSRWLATYDKLIHGVPGISSPELTENQIVALIEAIETAKPKIGTALFLLKSGRLTA